MKLKLKIKEQAYESCFSKIQGNGCFFFKPHYIDLAAFSNRNIHKYELPKKAAAQRIPQFPALSCECPYRFSHVSE